VQEPWEIGFTMFAPSDQKADAKHELQISYDGEFMLRPNDMEYTHISGGFGLSGDFLQNGRLVEDVYYPLSSTSWYPRHGFLPKSTFDLTYRVPKGFEVASVGEPVPSDAPLTKKWKSESPIAFAGFGVGRFFVTHTNVRDTLIPLDYFAATSVSGTDKQEFLLTEMSNAMKVFHDMFGTYTYPRLKAVMHPRGFGQGFPTLLFLAPVPKRTDKYVFDFVSHEVSHQWWGNMVSWRSYRDQWLSEGFAKYSGMLYTQQRMNTDAVRELLIQSRKVIAMPQLSETAMKKTRMTDIGPLILGLRLQSSESMGGYYVLTYYKGGLVLRMLHYLFSDPSTGADAAFFDMMKDFVAKHKNRPATTESFGAVANEHFARTPIAKRYGVGNLGWFFKQWVYQTHLPSYKLDYTIEEVDGKVLVKGNVLQSGAPDDWFMPLPLTIKMGKDQIAKGSVAAKGPSTPFTIALPTRPLEVTLDPDMWILSERTETTTKKK
jgi:aminopeptidase N